MIVTFKISEIIFNSKKAMLLIMTDLTHMFALAEKESQQRA